MRVYLKSQNVLCFLFLVFVFVLLPIQKECAAQTDTQARQPVDIGSRLELFVDSHVIGSMNGTALRLHEPRDEGAVLKFDEPWEGGVCAYCTVFKDNELYRLYYRGGPQPGGGDCTNEVTCYAQSQDGIHWVKPELGFYDFKGSKKNNIILSGEAVFCHNFAPFLDKRPNIPQEQKYKALAGVHQTGLVPFVSADGIHWSKLQTAPVLKSAKFALDSQNVSFWSEAEQKYVCYLRNFVQGVRSIVRVESTDFLHWTPKDGDQMLFGDTPMEHLYTNQTSPYFRAPHIYFATAARFVPERRLITPEQAKTLQIGWGQIGQCSDSVLMSTRGGNVYTRTFMEGLIRPGIGLENWNSRSNYPACGIVQTGPCEMSMYVQHHYGQPIHELHRYSVRLDGFISVSAPYQGGEFITKPLMFSGGRLLMNASTSAAGTIQVELLDEKGNPYPGFALADSVSLTGNWIEKEVVWKSGSVVKSLIGKPVVVRFVMKDADLYSIRFAN
ncbi:MAG: hypothetical protein PHQ75_01920 [Thermoguttaceae bacterium]|nr:hypothetical protein [Thermoguttaceae bacterium]